MITFHLISIFPESFESYLNTSILRRARKNKLIKVNSVNLKNFASDKYHLIDDSPYGGGPGMVLKFEPIFRATESVKKKILRSKKKNQKTKIIIFSTRGKKLDDKTIKHLSKYNNLILICGRYEGIDERVAKYIADEEISVGDYILSGGELPALILLDAISRKLPGVLGKQESLEEVKGSYPVYTKPESIEIKLKTGKIKKLKVPKVLLSGNHKKINEWREKNGNINQKA